MDNTPTSHRKPVLCLVAILSALILALGLQQGLNAAQPGPFTYVFPPPDAEMVSRGTTVAVRVAEAVDTVCLEDVVFEVTGNRSGIHSGKMILADDNRTLVFVPDERFTFEENVSVRLRKKPGREICNALSTWEFSFVVEGEEPAEPSSLDPASLHESVDGLAAEPQISSSGVFTSPQLVTVPDDYPNVTVTLATDDVGEGYIFLSNFYFFGQGFSGTQPYLLILDDRGEPVFYQKMAYGYPILDFKKQPNGTLTYWNQQYGRFFALDENYRVVDTYQAGNGHTADLHDLQILPNGHVLLMVYDYQSIDMSKVVPGGVPTATVTGLIIQELDTHDNVVFEWRSWDHFNITDTQVSLTTPRVDYVHGNAVELDHDGNVLLSSRHLSEITKINRQTGEIIWRWGGKNNEFQLIGDSQPFAYQHDVRRLPNGHITIFDNRNNLEPRYSAAVEYILDEQNKTATLYREYRKDPDIYAPAMGNAQRLANGNTVIGWGLATPTVTEFAPDGRAVFELMLSAEPVQYYSYRAFRFPWTGRPTWAPHAVLTTDGITKTLHYSWNGATEIDYYEIHAGNSPISTTVVLTQSKQGFETKTVLTPAMLDYCYLQVMPIDNEGNTTTFSKKIINPHPGCNFFFLPILYR